MPHILLFCSYLHVFVNNPLRHCLRLLGLGVAEQLAEIGEALYPSTPRLGGRFDDPHVLAEVPV